MNNIFTEHPQSLYPPESYCTHLIRSSKNGCILIVGGIIAIIHALFPFLFEVTTSDIIIRLYWSTIDQFGRHAHLVKKWRHNR